MARRALSEDEALAAARAREEAILKLARPVDRPRRSKSDVGDGDTCPLFPFHGRMVVLGGSNPPIQFCPHVIHDGRKIGPAPSRALWPLYGFEETVVTHKARLDRALKQAQLPDLSDLTLEVI